MDTRQLGKTGPTVSAIGLGAMGMSALYGPSDRDESLATVHAALDRGVTLLDTGDFYGMGHNELLIRGSRSRTPSARSPSSSRRGTSGTSGCRRSGRRRSGGRTRCIR